MRYKLIIHFCFSDEKFYQQFTPEEKAKLYGAIGYEENESDPTLPKEVRFHSYNRINIAVTELLYNR